MQTKGRDLKVYIKNMVCDRCKLVIGNVVEQLGLSPAVIDLGLLEFANDLTDQQLQDLQQQIEPLGFALVNDKKTQLIESIKSEIIRLVHNEQALEKIKLSDYLKKRLHHDYNYLSNLFSSVEGTTIEHYHIKQKIERAKELLVYDELTLTQIADQLGYSSVAHLSSQFKKVTGLTPTHFKRLKDAKHRQPLDKV